MYNKNNDNNDNNVKNFPGKTCFVGFQLKVFENNRTFMEKKKKAALHTTTLMHCKARQVLRDLFWKI